ncbi:MAG: putative Mitogen-activated protein kinase kinase kinase NPK1, partial [Streblomastix strix]
IQYLGIDVSFAGQVSYTASNKITFQPNLPISTDPIDSSPFRIHDGGLVTLTRLYIQRSNISGFENAPIALIISGIGQQSNEIGKNSPGQLVIEKCILEGGNSASSDAWYNQGLAETCNVGYYAAIIADGQTTVQISGSNIKTFEGPAVRALNGASITIDKNTTLDNNGLRNRNTLSSMQTNVVCEGGIGTTTINIALDNVTTVILIILIIIIVICCCYCCIQKNKAKQYDSHYVERNRKLVIIDNSSDSTSVEADIEEKEEFEGSEYIGQGAFGRVFLSYNKDIGLIAAKVMQSKVFDENEWDAAGRLQQGEPIPFIVQFKSAKNFGEYVVILMEFANLKSLDNIIKKNYTLTPGTLRAIAKQLFEGLRLIHEKGLVHRDIKGENLMMHCPPGSNRVIVKIADFGLVKLQGGEMQKTMLMSAKGTPLNMAPELVVGDGKADAKVDVWSMGVVLFQLAGHEYPIKATTVPDLQKLMRQRQIIRPKAITDNLLWDLLMKLLQFDKKDRPTAEQALQHPYFTGEQALKDISRLQHQIANVAQQCQQRGDSSITIYDINASYSVPGNEIKAAISYDPDVDLQNNSKLYINNKFHK